MKKMNRNLLYFCCLMLLAANQIYAQRDYQFIGMDQQNPLNWFSNANWNCSPSPCMFPGAEDTARIGTLLPMGGGYITYTPRAVGTAQVKDLNILSGSKLTFTTFTTTGTFNLGDLPTTSATLEAFVNGSVFNNNGTLNVLTTTGGGSQFSGVFTFFNNGTFNLNKLNIAGQTIVNQQGASIFIGDFSIGIGAWTLDNRGLLSKPSSPGTATLNLVDLTNRGSIEAGNGILELGASGSTLTARCGRFRTLAPAATIKFLATLTVASCTSLAENLLSNSNNPKTAIQNPQFLDPGDTVTSLRGEGLIDFTSDIVINDPGGITFGFAHPTSGAITGGNVTTRGNISGAGPLRLIADAQNPTVHVFGGGAIGGSGNFVIDNGATLDINPPGAAGSVQMTQRTITNNGLIRWTNGNIGGFGAGFVLNNSLGGVVEIRSDKNLSGSFSPLPVINNSGIFRKTLSAGTTNLVAAFNNGGTTDVQTGTLRLSAVMSHTTTGAINVNSGAAFEITSGVTFNFNQGGSVTGDGFFKAGTNSIVNINAPLSISGLEITGGTLNGTGAAGILRVPRFLSVSDNAILNTALIEIQAAALLGTAFYNNGTTLNNRGTANAISNASLRQNSGAAFNLNNFGIVNPGQPLGTLFMDGNYTQSSTGTLNIDIGGTTPGTQHDQLRVFNGAAGGTGNVNMSGTLNVNFVNGFVPAANQFFQIMTCQTACNGQFSQINGVNVGTDKILVPGYGPNAVSLITTQINAGIPAPNLIVAERFGNTTRIVGSYTAAPNTQYLITLYQGCSASAQSNLRGTTLLTDSNGFVIIDVTLPFPMVAGAQISARATDAANQTSNLSNCIFVRKRGNAADFDGDNLTDISIFRPNNNFSEFVPGLSEWWYQRSSDNVTVAYQFGTPNDKIVPGDYTGDGKTDIAFWRPSTGFWFVLRSEDLTYFATPFGISSDKPAPADFDGDGKTDFAVFRPSNGTWFINRSSGGIDIIPFGLSGDVPQPNDYDGDGKADIAIFRPAGSSGQGEWWVQRSTGGIFAISFGVGTDKPVAGDYTGDGKADIAFWRPSTGFWFVLRSEDSSFYAVPFGTNGDIPTPGDYDGDGKNDLGVFRPSSVTWFVQKSIGGFLIQQFGLATDIPVPSAFVP